MALILFSDLHYGNTIRDKAGKVGVSTFGDNRDALIQLRSKIKPEDIVINLGDVISATSKDQALQLYKDFISIFAGVEMYHLYGNHDVKFITFDELEELTDQPRRFVFTHNELNLILIDPFVDGNKIVVSQETIEWLKDKLQKPCILYTHFPISEDPENLSYYHIDRPHCAFIKQSGVLRQMLKDSGCKAVVSGHTHFHFEKMIDGIKHITVPSFSENVAGKPSTQYAEFSTLTLGIKLQSL